MGDPCLFGRLATGAVKQTFKPHGLMFWIFTQQPQLCTITALTAFAPRTMHDDGVSSAFFLFSRFDLGWQVLILRLGRSGSPFFRLEFHGSGSPEEYCGNGVECIWYMQAASSKGC